MKENLKYQLALSILNSMIWIYFKDLENARKEETPDTAIIGEMKVNFAKACVRRDDLVNADETEWQLVIDEFGPVAACRSDALELAA